MATPNNIKDLSNQRFEWLVVQSYCGPLLHKSGSFDTSGWTCLCDCGQVVTRGSRDLVAGKAKSCGCKRVCKTEEERALRRKVAAKKYDDAHKEDAKAYRNSPKGRFIHIKQCANRREHPFELTLEHYESAFYDTQCSYCKRPSNGGIDQIIPGNGYVDGNMRACCSQCNTAKLNRPDNDFYVMCDLVSRNKPAKLPAWTDIFEEA